MPGLPSLLLAGLAAAGAGFVNALAGGGTLLSFPVLILLGLPATVANVTNTLALLPGYLAASWAQRGELRIQARRLRVLGPAALLGGLCGALALLATGEALFRRIVPFLIYLGVALLAAQGPVRAWLGRKGDRRAQANAGPGLGAILALGGAAIYGGYFGAGVSVIILAVLALSFDDELGRLNALKQALSLGANLGAAVYFALTAPVSWPYAGVMALGALGGGSLGGKLAGRIRPGLLKALVLVLGTALATWFLFKD